MRRPKPPKKKRAKKNNDTANNQINQESRIFDPYEDDDSKKQYLAKRLVVAIAADCELCECGGLIYDLGDFRACGDCGAKY